MKIFILLFLLLVPTHEILAEDNAPEAQLDARKVQDDDIREAVFRYQIAKHKSDLFFLGLFPEKEKPEVDPTPEFLKRFKDLKVSIQKASAAKSAENNAPTDKATGKIGLSLSVEGIEWISDKEVKVHGSVFAGALNAAGYIYILKKEKDGWKVVKSGAVWLS